jgi:FAD binding domain
MRSRGIDTSIDPLREQVPVVLPGEPDYDRLAPAYNLAIPSTPAAVVPARDADDVAAVVRFAAGAGLPVAVQSTGHGATGGLDGALLVHTGGLTGCTVDAGGRARVGAGVTWRQLLDAAAPHGLGAPAGASPGVGVVGYCSGGGIGPASRTYGHGSDAVRAVELVTGDGELRRIEPGHELFAAVRGGKGAVGIITAVELGLVHQPELYAGSIWFDGAAAAEVLGTWRSWAEQLPEQATTSIALMQLPAVPGVPPPLAGKPTLSVRYVWTGDPAAGEDLLRPLRTVAEPLLDAMGMMPFAGIGAVHNDPPDPMPAHEETDLLHSLPDAALDALLAVAGPAAGSPLAAVELRQLGGAMARPPAEPDMNCHRDAAYNLFAVGALVPPVADAVPGHARKVRAAMAPWATGGALPNFAAGTGPARLARSYDPATLTRLTDLAVAYDPAGVLRVGQVPER